MTIPERLTAIWSVQVVDTVVDRYMGESQSEGSDNGSEAERNSDEELSVDGAAGFAGMTNTKEEKGQRRNSILWRRTIRLRTRGT